MATGDLRGKLKWAGRKKRPPTDPKTVMPGAFVRFRWGFREGVYVTAVVIRQKGNGANLQLLCIPLMGEGTTWVVANYVEVVKKPTSFELASIISQFLGDAGRIPKEFQNEWVKAWIVRFTQAFGSSRLTAHGTTGPTTEGNAREGMGPPTDAVPSAS
jgi:hypothetical protein